jgi:hypothetical protein
MEAITGRNATLEEKARAEAKFRGKMGGAPSK